MRGLINGLKKTLNNRDMIKFNWKHLLFGVVLASLSSLLLVNNVGWETYFWIVFFQTMMAAVLIIIQENL